MGSKGNGEKLLQLAVSASSGDSHEIPERSQQDREWLNSAVNGFMNQGVNLVDDMKRNVSLIHKSLSLNSEEDIANILSALEDIADTCENIDFACDLHKISGFPVIIACLRHGSPKIRSEAANLLAICAQNNEYCQNQLLQLKVLKDLLKMTNTQASSEINALEDAVAVKAIYAVSCMVRQNQSCYDEFKLLDGYSYLVRALQSNSDKIKMKALFLLFSLCESNTDSFDYIFKMGFVIQIAAELLQSKSQFFIEFSLRLLVILTSKHEGIKKELQNQTVGLADFLNKLPTQKDIWEDHDEIQAACNQLQEFLFFSSDDDSER